VVLWRTLGVALPFCKLVSQRRYISHACRNVSTTFETVAFGLSLIVFVVIQTVYLVAAVCDEALGVMSAPGRVGWPFGRRACSGLSDICHQAQMPVIVIPIILSLNLACWVLLDFLGIPAGIQRS